MDDYDYAEMKGPGRRKKKPGGAWNILTILVLLITVCLAAAFLLIYINPYNVLNPFPPPRRSPTPTATTIPRFTLVPTWTPTEAVTQAVFTETPEPTHTPLYTVTSEATSTSLPPTLPASTPALAFGLREGSPVAIEAAQFHIDADCKWSGVAGQATSLNGEGVKGLFVQLGSSQDGNDKLDNSAMTGLAPQYGEGGFEITIADKPVASQGSMWVQLLDAQNLPLSNRIYFDTYDDCTKNLVIIYFDQVR